MPSTIVLGPSKDNTIYQNAAAISNGAGSTFIAGETNGLTPLIRRGLIAFDIAGNIPAGSTINSVILTLHMSKARFSSGTQTVGLYPLLADWGEGTSNADLTPGQGATATTNDATWTYRFYNTATWNTQGGDFATTASATTGVGGVDFYTWGSTPQMVANVQNWLNNSTSNFGWLVRGNETQTGTAKGFDSGDNSTAANRPMLTIDYTSPILQVAGFPSPVTAGVPGMETVTAKNSSGMIVTGYRGTVHFTSTDPQAGLPADYTFTAADAGVHSFSVTLKTAGPQSITATDTVYSSITGSQTGISVSPAAAASFVLSGFPSSVTAGVAGTETVTAKDAFGNTATGYIGTVHFTSSDLQAVLPANYTFTAADAGVHSFSATLKTAGMQLITATDTAFSSITGSQSGITVSPSAIDHLQVTTPSSATAGASFDVRVTAQDPYNNTVTNYTGTVTFTSSDTDLRVVLPAAYPFMPSDNGVHTFSGGATLISAGSQTITATDTATSSVNGTGTVTVTPGALDHLSLTSAGTVAAGMPFDLIVTAQDAFGNTVTSYTGTVTFTSTDQDPGVMLPAQYPFTSSDSGTHTFSGGATLFTPGQQTITVTDDGGLTAMLTVTL